MPELDELQAQISALKSELEQARTLQTISRGVNAAHNEAELLKALAQPALKAGAASANLSYTHLNGAGNPVDLETVASVNAQPDVPSPVGMRVHWTKYAVAQVWRDHPDSPLYIADAQTDMRLDKAARARLLRFGIRAQAAIPLRQGGRWVGALTFDWKEPHDFDASECAVYDALPVLAASAIENQRLVSRLEKMVEVRTAELQEHQFLFQTFLDNFPDLVFAKDMQGRILLSNRALETAFSVEPGALIGRTARDFMPKSVADEMWASEKRVLEFQAPQEIEETFPIDGQVRTKLTIKFPLYDAQGKAYAVGGIATDITARKQAEAEREQLQRDVIEAQQRALREMATPIIPVMNAPNKGSILVMPLIGSIDAMRARDMMRALLAGISEHRARVVIIDMTGVPVIDTGIANVLNKIIQAAQLKGARAIVTGISEAVAEAIVDLGIDWSRIATLNDLHTGLLVAMYSIGLRIISVKSQDKPWILKRGEMRGIGDEGGKAAH